MSLDLTSEKGLGTSRALHRLRVLQVPGYVRDRGPSIRSAPTLVEDWTIERVEMRLPRLIEAGAYGGTLAAAAGAALEERFTDSGPDARKIAQVLFDVALCGIEDLSERITDHAAELVSTTTNLAALGLLLDVALGLWRHDRIFGAAGSTRLAPIISAGVRRALWLAEGIRGGAAPADPDRLFAIVAVRDSVLHAGTLLDTSREAVAAVFERLAADPDVPPDMRGASFGFAWALGKVGDVERAVRGAGNSKILGDWLAGLFALAREEVLELDGGVGVLKVIDELVGGMTERDFLVALPSLRQAFVFFPPRERESIAKALLEARGKHGSPSVLLRTTGDPAVMAWALEVEQRVDDVLRREKLVNPEGG